jgi:competence protein ComEC
MDDIQRKLELIDKQLTGGFAEYHKQIVSTAPLLFAAVGLIAGILIQDAFGLAVWVWLVFVGVCVATTIILNIVYRGKEEKLPYILAYIALVCCTCLGAIRLSSYKQPANNDIRNLISHEFPRINTKKQNVDSRLRGNDRSEGGNDRGGERKLATIRGTIITKPYVNKNEGWAFAKFAYTDPSSSFYLKLGEVETVDGWAKVSGVVRVQVDEKVLGLKEGDYIQAYCWLSRFEKATNPGQFDTAEYLARKGIFVAASVKSRDSIELLQSKGEGIFTKIKSEFRQAANQALSDDLSIEDRNRGLLEALLLGYRGNIDSGTYRAFNKTGLLHFISLSGLHLGIFAGIVWWLCKTAGLLKRGRAIICIIAIGVFLLIVPPRAPTLRAAIIVFVFCISFFFRRRPNPLNTLSLAAIILLLIRPTDLFEAGWQLSFASVLGILLFCQRILFFLYENITGHSWLNDLPKTKPFFQIVPRPGPYALQLLSTSIAAWLSSAGILLYHFYTINPLTIIWTVIVFPFVAGILTFGYLKIILSFLLPGAAMVLGVVVNFLSDLLIWIVKLFAHVDLSQILIGHVPIVMIIFYYSFVLFAGFIYFRRPLIKKAICTAMILAMIVFLGVTKWQRTYRDNLTITCLDVGHGQAILAKLPGGTNILFDAGSLHKSDIGRRIVAPFLNYCGINRIDSIIISHNDIDHINGIPEIAECCEVGGVYANDAFFSQTDRWGTVKFLEKSLSEKGLEIKSLTGLDPDGAADIKILWPSEQALQEQLSDNNKSLVLLIQFGNVKILLCSDIEKSAQAELLRLYPDLKADVVVVPHHGSRKTTEQHFLENLDAEILICSCGRSDYTNGRTIKPKNRAKWRCTAEHGAVVICIDKNGMIR